MNNLILVHKSIQSLQPYWFSIEFSDTKDKKHLTILN